VEEHVELVEAIQAGDGERSEAIMRRHVAEFYAQVRQVLKAMD
jgi:DNA-binding GntR family transcriptional regulator